MHFYIYVNQHDIINIYIPVTDTATILKFVDSKPNNYDDENTSMNDIEGHTLSLSSRSALSRSTSGWAAVLRLSKGQVPSEVCAITVGKVSNCWITGRNLRVVDSNFRYFERSLFTEYRI